MAEKKSAEELANAKKAAKEELQVAKDELKAFRKENKLDKEKDYSADEKHGKKYTKLVAQVTKKTKALEDAETAAKGEKKAAGRKATKYEYPKDATADDKKKIRASARAAAKRALKEEKAGEKKEGKKKEEKKGEEKAGEKKLSKSERRALKKAEAKKEGKKED